MGILLYVGEAFLLLIATLLVTTFYVAWWRILEKAGKPGWAFFIPIYGLVVILQMVGKPVWWLAVMMLCFPAALVMQIIVLIALAQRFGKGVGFGIALLILPYIFIPILGFGSAQYEPPPEAA